MKNGLVIITSHVIIKESVQEKMTVHVSKTISCANQNVVANFIVPLSILDVLVKMHRCALMSSLRRGS